jgi:hypothetical protein
LKKLAFVGGAAGLGLMALLHSPMTNAADHLDAAASLATNPMADINDVYAWMTTDAATVNLAMTVSPGDDGTRAFGPSVLYAFHVTSRPGFGMAGVESKVICKFASNTSGECWVVDPSGKVLDYVKGDLSGPVGRVSHSGQLRVFAGQRSDPFFFNLGGYASAVTAAETACGGGTKGSCPGLVPTDAAGCLQIGKATGDALRSLLTNPPATPVTIIPGVFTCPAASDCFAGLNVMAIVVQVDKTLLVSGMDKLVSVWGSTHAGS